MLLVSLISYIDRNTLALLIPTIMKETHLSAEQYGWIVSAFSVAYMISNPLWGALLDKLGLRIGMMAAVFLWTIASMSHALAGGFLSFALARTALGLGEGATFPGGLRAVVQTLRPAEQARGIALAYSGGSLGAILTPIIVTPIFLWWGWRAAFLFTGAIGLAWLVMWYFVSLRDDVRNWKPEPTSAPLVPMRFTDAKVWSFILAYGLGSTPLGFVLYASAIYLNRVIGMDQAQLGKVLWIPPLGWEVGYVFWGYLFDRMVSAGIPRMTAIRRMMFAAMFLSLPIAIVPWVTQTWIVLAQLFFAMFVIVAFVVPSVSYATYVYSKERAGLIAGIGAGAYGAIVMITMPVFGRLFDMGRYDIAFVMAAILPIAGYYGWYWLNRVELATLRAPEV